MVVSTDLEASPVELTRRLGALAEPIRLSIVGVLADGEHCVCGLLERVPVAANLLSYHLGVLREAGLVRASRRGRWVDYRLDPDGFAALWDAVDGAGVPLPGAPVRTERRGSTCPSDEVDQ